MQTPAPWETERASASSHKAEQQASEGSALRPADHLLRDSGQGSSLGLSPSSKSSATCSYSPKNGAGRRKQRTRSSLESMQSHVGNTQGRWRPAPCQGLGGLISWRDSPRNRGRDGQDPADSQFRRPPQVRPKRGRLQGESRVCTHSGDFHTHITMASNSPKSG